MTVTGDFETERNYSGFNLKLRWIFNSSNIKTAKLVNTQTEVCNYDFDFHCPYLSLLNVSGWVCNYLNPSIFNKCGQLRYFNISNSQLGSGFKNDVDCRFLVNKYHLEELDLSYNNLDRLCNSLLNDSSHSLRKLHLDLNFYRHLPSALRVLKRMKYVSLRHNILEYFDEQDLMIMEGANGTSFDFYGNSFDCSCKAKEGIVWMSEHAEKIASIKTLKCIDGRDLSDMIHNIHYYRLRCLSIFWLQFSIISLLFIMITILLILVGAKHKALVLYFYLRAKHFLRGRKTQEKNEYKFDIFISYSQEDCDWVVNCLYRKLSGEFKLRVCFHENDFKPGMRISDNIYNCIVNSRLHLFVITQAFLQSTWGMYEMELTRECVLRSREDENIIVLFKDDIPVSDMPKALKEVWFRVTCLKWPGDNSDIEQANIFWKRLADVSVLK
ncbi:hypothetical protein FSP39_016912 [Pinctada imbricata]|uniref:TIR domain-containing protein n=1 Tax=Pinctada imbricata TaxID=66713 RepID=A0AA88YRP4_PINIB|nr:hypothetical protein FSP39_016912 [Pinctada imbricata]